MEIRKFFEFNSYDDDIAFGLRHKDGRPKKILSTKYDDAVKKANFFNKKYHLTHTFKVVQVLNGKDDHRFYYAITSKRK
jgi:hypothetical protein